MTCDLALESPLEEGSQGKGEWMGEGQGSRRVWDRGGGWLSKGPF